MNRALPRVLLATDAFPPVCGGSGWSTYELAKGLRRRGHDVVIVQPRPGDTPGTRTREYDGFEVAEIGSWAPAVPFLRNYVKNERLYPRLGTALAAIVRERQVDVIHGQHVLTAPAAVLAGATAGCPVVCTIRDYWPVCYWADLIHDRDADHLCPACTTAGMLHCVRPRAGSAWPVAVPLVPYMRSNLAHKRAALARADAIVAVSSTIASDLRARAPELAGTRLEIIPNPVDIDAIAATAAARPRPQAGPYALFVGKLEPNKGAQFLVPALAASRLPWPSIVVGDGTMRAQIETQAAATGVALDLRGWLPREDVLAWMAHAEVLLFPSKGPESLSRVLLEASALGVPIAAMDTGGTRDIVVDGQTGLLSATPARFADDLARLARDPALRRQLGEAARVHVARQFAAPTVVDRIAALYDSLLTASGSARA